ncbi:hypothetical protein BT69DRAFT_236807 [Atractiella rhizophila]|nr:hypothetical protein BT69DRAFT_236807 [Atractiella rhizophila]
MESKTSRPQQLRLKTQITKVRLQMWNIKMFVVYCVAFIASRVVCVSSSRRRTTEAGQMCLGRPGFWLVAS